MKTKKCPNCQEAFSRKPSELKRCAFCSKSCRVEYTHKSRETKCKYCGKVFYPEKRKNRKDPQYCGRSCMGADYATLNYNISFMDEHIDFIDGFLLGDGHISKDNCHLSWSFKHDEFSKFIENNLSSYSPKSMKRFVKDKRLKNGGTFSIRGNTKCHPDFKKQRDRWYPCGVKTVPKDVSVSPSSMLVWYLGDGMLLNYSAMLCTDSFLESDVDFLIKQIRNVGITCNKRDTSGKPRIVIPSSGLKSLFNYIGWESPVSCYDYKFDTYQHRDRGYNTSERNMSKPQ